MAVVAVVLAVIGLGIAGDLFNDHLPAYSTTTIVIAAACAVIAAVFIMMSAVCGK